MEGIRYSFGSRKGHWILISFSNKIFLRKEKDKRKKGRFSSGVRAPLLKPQDSAVRQRLPCT